MSSSRIWLLSVLALVLVACASPPPKPTEIEMPSEDKHFIVSRPGGPARP